MKLLKSNNNDKRAIQPMNIRDAMDRFFEQSLWDPFNSFFDSRFPLNETAMFMPKIDISEDKKNLKIEVNIPGYDPKNIEVQVDESMVIIKGKAEEQNEEKDQKYYRRERSYGEFYREISLPSHVDSSKASCRSNHGVLTITIPKTESKERKNLKIETVE